ncbi:major capsid protein [Aliagarivorans taiwanensis]|uniref:major capsid protein n=1 Tax=Aliagarivorans taiwanensis TaxID=561966 RepID=UPI00040CC928|nr:major capsid protein [Aliagarivorans taiwanensis]
MTEHKILTNAEDPCFGQTEAQQAFVANSWQAWANTEQSLQNNSSVPEQAQFMFESMDSQILQLVRPMLSVYGDLADLASPLDPAVVEAQYLRGSDGGETVVSLNGTPPRVDKLTFSKDGASIPCFESRFGLDWREFLQAQQTGALDLTNSESLQNVARSIESVLTTGADLQAKKYGVDSFLNGDGINEHAGMDIAGASSAEFVELLLNMADELDKLGYDSGKKRLYVSPTAWRKLADDYSGSYAQTIRERLMKTEAFDRITKVNSFGANDIVIFEPSRRVVELKIALPPSVTPLKRLNERDQVQWSAFAIAGLQIKRDHSGKTGIIKTV